MLMTGLPPDWMPTRTALQAYARTVTAFPRAAAPHDPRWSHVAMDPHPDGFVTRATPLADGEDLVSVLDLERHQIRATAGRTALSFDLAGGPGSRSIGEAILSLVDIHGSIADVDQDRFGTDEPLTYDQQHAAAFLEASRIAIDALECVNETLRGDVSGPHLWPHGFDIATEWFSDRTVPHGDSHANAQIAMGWYPGESSYVYVNPWPFRPEFEAIDLPHGAVWHLDDWQGARLEIDGAGVPIDDVVDLGMSLHRETAGSLGT